MFGGSRSCSRLLTSISEVFKHLQNTSVAANHCLTFALQIASLIAGVEFGKSVYVPSVGWAVFGQLGNKLNRSQVLPTLDGEWQEGPELAGPNAHKASQCMFQVSNSRFPY